ncbi:nitrate reductase molybdenum cofactor assembly chaperone [uncultured Paraglaciecola sp.]|uniref:nitrate reductase molybdenum cofactor assembly chaperone n=1 Tax=uncultured Paraglaciecola sp. TaxID=1765024 RepID=UPI0025D06434|nr:nitrate reductase molybdenum cofactor assembly chaperone [uncultured Paraglaciecola sp.]
MKQIKILSLLSRLIDYPTEQLFAHHQGIAEFIEHDEFLDDEQRNGLLAFVDKRFSGDLLDWQSEYDGLFERGRMLSLLLYEHIHGESRDRGQAMVDLLKQYRAAGLDIGVHELPDYIPLFVEFASTQGAENAKGWLQDVAPILALLAVRLQKRESNYAALFTSLLHISGADIDMHDIALQVKNEKRDDTKKAMDKVWEEEAVTFGGDAVNGGCPTDQNKPSESQRRDQDVPIQFFDASQVKQADGELRS